MVGRLGKGREEEEDEVQSHQLASKIYGFRAKVSFFNRTTW